MDLLSTIDAALGTAEAERGTRAPIHVTRLRQIRDEFVRLRAANEAADKYIDRLEEIVRRGNSAPSDIDHCQRMYAHHKLQLHTRSLSAIKDVEAEESGRRET